MTIRLFVNVARDSILLAVGLAPLMLRETRMKRLARKPLRMNPETIRALTTLTGDQLARIAGAFSTQVCTHEPLTELVCGRSVDQ